MPTLLNNCGSCVDLVFAECEDIEIAPQSGLSANTEYYWELRDQHDNVWKGNTTTSANGVITLASDFFPDGLFVTGIGSLSIVVKEHEGDTESVELTWNGIAYSCVNISFENVQPLNPYGY